jgi:hypothetical protein
MKLNSNTNKSTRSETRIDVKFVEDPEDICADLAYVASALEEGH